MKYIDDIRDWLIANNLVTGYKVHIVTGKQIGRAHV